MIQNLVYSTYTQLILDSNDVSIGFVKWIGKRKEESFQWFSHLLFSSLILTLAVIKILSYKWNFSLPLDLLCEKSTVYIEQSVEVAS